MKVYYDIGKAKQKVVKTIKKYGFSPEHNYYNYLYMQNGSNRKCVFLDFGGDKGIIALFNKSNNTWRVINSVFAPGKERIEIFIKFLDWATINKGSKKVFVESLGDFKSEVFRKLKDTHRFNTSYSLSWPIYNLDSLDMNLSGKDWKKLRNIRNRFFNRFRVQVKNPKSVNKEILKNVLHSWIRKRYPRDRANNYYYLNVIDSGFKGFDIVRSISLNGKVCSFSGGWVIPNNGNFYYSIGIFDYNYKNIGDFINLDDLLHIKKLGWRYVDLGGSDKSTIAFKRKFKPVKIYQTYFFSISPKH